MRSCNASVRWRNASASITDSPKLSELSSVEDSSLASEAGNFLLETSDPRRLLSTLCLGAAPERIAPPAVSVSSSLSALSLSDEESEDYTQIVVSKSYQTNMIGM